MRLLDRLFPKYADRQLWRAEERLWLESNQCPRRVVRVYRSQRQQRRDTRRLRRLGYEVLFQNTSRVEPAIWRCHVTYNRRDDPTG